MKQYYVYILANKIHRTIYIGMTNSLLRRIAEHKQLLISGFTKKYKITKLVYYESTSDVREAIIREKRLKKWRRQWKIELIESNNPSWSDLYEQLV